MRSTALLIGTRGCIELVERQLDLLPARPITIGWVLAGDGGAEAETAGAAAPSTGAIAPAAPILGRLADLESIVARRRPALALVSLPAAMSDLIATIRTRLRRLGVPDRFLPTLADQLDGVGPRTHFELDPAHLLGRSPRPIERSAIERVVGGRTVLITGAGGSIGGELARLAAEHTPARLLLMDRSENALFEIDRQIARRAPALERHALLHDVVDAEATLALCRRFEPQLILHAAAHKHVPMMEDHPGAAVDNNLFGTIAIADAADAVGTERLVMISTDKAVNPSSIMGATKRLAELYIQDLDKRSSTAFSMVRFGNVLGSAGSVLETWSRQIAEGGPVTVTDPAMTRYFMTIPEAAALVIEAAALVDPDAPSGQVFVLDMGEPIRILDMAERFVRLHGFEPAVAVARAQRPAAASSHSGAPALSGHGTMRIVFTGRRAGEKLHEELEVADAELEPTAHEGIVIWRLPHPDPARLKESIWALAPEHRDPDPRRLARAIRAFVPEQNGFVAA